MDFILSGMAESFTYYTSVIFVIWVCVVFFNKKLMWQFGIRVCRNLHEFFFLDINVYG